jgi:hypothetical protein
MAASTGSSAVAVIAASSHPVSAGANTLLSTGTSSSQSPTLTAYFENADYEDNFGIVVITSDTWNMWDGVAWQNYKAYIGSDTFHYDLLTQDYWSGTIDLTNTGDPDDILPSGVDTSHVTRNDNELIFSGGPTKNGCGPFYRATRDTPAYKIFDPCAEDTANYNGHVYTWPAVSDAEAIGSENGGYFWGGVGYNALLVMTQDFL